ncbi:MAG: primosomal protein N' [Elusimicrobia bacterium]|nr:primosomal protein N' [Elusimicrobiota bacterium]
MFASVSFPLGLFPPQTFEYIVPENLKDQIFPGSWVQAVFGRRRIWGVVETTAATPLFNGRHQQLLAANNLAEPLRSRVFELAGRMAGFYACSTAQAFKTAVAFPHIVEHSFLEQKTQNFDHPPLRFTPTQQTALDALGDEIKNLKRPAYLWGPTGSGKTYVLLGLIQKILSEGKSAIYLVPEITLTPQFLDIFEKELALPKEIFALWNSKVAPSQKKIIWSRILSGETRLALGTRSAVFLPLRNLGLIALDEEQDASFKQETPAPAYHAREIALWRSQMEGCAVVMSSATPSLECYQAVKEGALKTVKIQGRYQDRPMPKIQLQSVDSRNEEIGGPLCQAIKEKITSGQHVLLYHNRRGFNRVLECGHCKKPVSCSQCLLPLTLHKDQGSGVRGQGSGEKNGNSSHPSPLLKCHHCGIRRKMPEHCPTCKAPDDLLKPKGAGTQKIAQELENILGASVLRLDRDTAKNSSPIYEQFKSGQSKVLVGTKLIAKGWHFPLVTLAAVLDGDAELTLPDFRATERAFQTLLQVAGRSGRGETPGEVWIRTRQPEHYLFQSLEAQNLELFYEHELAIRQKMRLPPFSRLFTVELKGKSREKVAQAANSLLQTLEQHPTALNDNGETSSPLPTSIEVVGGGPSFFQKIRQNWRYEVVLRLTDPQQDFPMKLLGPVIAPYRKAGVSLRLHPDPQNLL